MSLLLSVVYNFNMFFSVSDSDSDSVRESDTSREECVTPPDTRAFSPVTSPRDDSPVTSPRESPVPCATTCSEDLAKCVCKLETRDLWEKFNELGTEMIITKSGR